MRARLQFQFDDDGTLLPSEGWEAVLEEAARHDPDNAFYDYLTALVHWNASCSKQAIPNAFRDQEMIDSIRVVNWHFFTRGTEAFDARAAEELTLMRRKRSAACD